jgi:2-polyprenyl-3-methyl-5-hydroxy-6-metoxy-1,4-benzoquinol methylase
MHDRVVQANRDWYAAHHGEYVDYRSSGAFLDWYAPEVENDLRIMGLAEGAAVLDCCAGTGLLTRMFARAGCRVTAVDVSEEMLGLIDVDAATVADDVVHYLAETDELYDVIVFGSALHHLWDYAHAVELAVERLRPGGFVYIVAEPIRQQQRLGRLVREFEFVWRKLRANPADVLPAVSRRLRFKKNASAPTRSTAPGDLVGLYAEIHAHGIDYERVRAVLPPPEVLRIVFTGPGWMRAVKRALPGYGGDNFTLAARRL